MPTDLLSVTETARDFLQKSGYSLIKLDKAYFDPEQKHWLLTFDVGITTPKLKEVEVDESSGKVVRFE